MHAVKLDILYVYMKLYIFCNDINNHKAKLCYTVYYILFYVRVGMQVKLDVLQYIFNFKYIIDSQIQITSA